MSRAAAEISGSCSGLAASARQVSDTTPSTRPVTGWRTGAPAHEAASKISL